MERNIFGSVKSGIGNITLEEWLEQTIVQEVIQGQEDVTITYGQNKGQKVKSFQACYVFSPKEARGSNGVLLTELLGIGDIKEMLT